MPQIPVQKGVFKASILVTAPNQRGQKGSSGPSEGLEGARSGHPEGLAQLARGVWGVRMSPLMTPNGTDTIWRHHLRHEMN